VAKLGVQLRVRSSATIDSEWPDLRARSRGSLKEHQERLRQLLALDPEGIYWEAEQKRPYSSFMEDSSPARRAAILDCVIRIIDVDGESAVRIADVRRETGASTSSIYHFFNNREGLIAAAHAQRFSQGILRQAEVYAPILAEAETRDEFRAAIIKLLEVTTGPQMMPVRKIRSNVVGSTLGRPVLAEAIAQVQERMLMVFAERIRPAQELGWIRADVDVANLAAWTISQLFGQVLFELGESSASLQEWRRLAIEATLFMYFREAPSAMDDVGKLA
jgi:AcrR family transcriptional regulator